jgi:hypothetical protein
MDHLNQHKCGFELILVTINYFEGINFVPQSWMIGRDHMLTKTIELPFNNQHILKEHVKGDKNRFGHLFHWFRLLPVLPLTKPNGDQIYIGSHPKP